MIYFAVLCFFTISIHLCFANVIVSKSFGGQKFLEPTQSAYINRNNQFNQVQTINDYPQLAQQNQQLYGNPFTIRSQFQPQQQQVYQLNNFQFPGFIVPPHIQQHVSNVGQPAYIVFLNQVKNNIESNKNNRDNSENNENVVADVVPTTTSKSNEHNAEKKAVSAIENISPKENENENIVKNNESKSKDNENITNKEVNSVLDNVTPNPKDNENAATPPPPNIPATIPITGIINDKLDEASKASSNTISLVKSKDNDNITNKEVDSVSDNVTPNPKDNENAATPPPPNIPATIPISDIINDKLDEATRASSNTISLVNTLIANSRSVSPGELLKSTQTLFGLFDDIIVAFDTVYGSVSILHSANTSIRDDISKLQKTITIYLNELDAFLSTKNSSNLDCLVVNIAIALQALTNTYANIIHSAGGFAQYCTTKDIEHFADLEKLYSIIVSVVMNLVNGSNGVVRDVAGNATRQIANVALATSEIYNCMTTGSNGIELHLFKDSNAFGDFIKQYITFIDNVKITYDESIENMLKEKSPNCPVNDDSKSVTDTTTENLENTIVPNIPDNKNSEDNKPAKKDPSTTIPITSPLTKVSDDILNAAKDAMTTVGIAGNITMKDLPDTINNLKISTNSVLDSFVKSFGNVTDHFESVDKSLHDGFLTFNTDIGQIESKLTELLNGIGTTCDDKSLTSVETLVVNVGTVLRTSTEHYLSILQAAAVVAEKLSVEEIQLIKDAETVYDSLLYIVFGLLSSVNGLLKQNCGSESSTLICEANGIHQIYNSLTAPDTGISTQSFSEANSFSKFLSKYINLVSGLSSAYLSNTCSITNRNTNLTPTNDGKNQTTKAKGPRAPWCQSILVDSSTYLGKIDGIVKNNDIAKLPNALIEAYVSINNSMTAIAHFAVNRTDDLPNSIEIIFDIIRNTQAAFDNALIIASKGTLKNIENAVVNFASSSVIDLTQAVIDFGDLVKNLPGGLTPVLNNMIADCQIILVSILDIAYELSTILSNKNTNSKVLTGFEYALIDVANSMLTPIQKINRDLIYGDFASYLSSFKSIAAKVIKSFISKISDSTGVTVPVVKK